MEARRTNQGNHRAQGEGAGQLILAATPIGNLSDASPRLISSLESADVIAAEDTRSVSRLAAGLGITLGAQQPHQVVVAHHEHNEAESTPALLERVEQGDTVVVVSDAGMPTISDPGFRLVQTAAQADLPVTCVPGPSAVTTALAVSGLPTDRFAFEGFVPKKAGEKRRFFTELVDEPRTSVFFESPHRVQDTLAVMAEVLGEERAGCVARELTKLHEEVIRGRLADLVEWSQTGTLKGEFVLLLGPATEPAGGQLSMDEQAEKVRDLVETHGMRTKDAAKQVAASAHSSARDLYNYVQQQHKSSRP